MNFYNEMGACRMKPLSELLEQADYDCETLWRYLEEAGHPPDGDAINTIKSVIRTLLDCERLAKSVESAPVGSVTAEGDNWVFYNAGEAGTVDAILDQRVALVQLPKQESE